MSDLRYALRQLVKSPGFTAVAVLTLALGLSVNATIFGFVRDMVIRPLERDQRANLAMLYTSGQGPDANFRRFSYREFETLRTAKGVFADVAATSFDIVALGEGDALRRSFACDVSENYFSLLDVRPFAGRFFSAEESRPSAGTLVAVASYAYWERLGRPADFIGRQIPINDRTFTIIGIAPPGFGGLHVTIGPEVWLPLGAKADLLNPKKRTFGACVSLPPNVTLEAAQKRLGSVEAILTQENAGDPRRLVLTPPPRFSLGNSQPLDESFIVPFAGAALALSITVLLVACLNLANMLLARGVSRRKEIALRLSLGATRWHIVRQLLVEGLLLGLAGGALGLLLSLWSGDLLQRTAYDALNLSIFAFNMHPPLDRSLLGAMFLLALLATLAFSLVPALRATRIDLVEDLKRQPNDPSGAGRWNQFFSLRHCLVMSQLALSLVLLFSAGLFVRSSWRAAEREPGFHTAGQLVFNFDYSFAGLAAEDVSRRQEAVLAHVATIAGVESAALASAVPHNFEPALQRVFAAGASGAAAPDEKDTTDSAIACFTAVSSGYFPTLGIPVLRGRDFTAAEAMGSGARPVAIIDDTLAKALFGDTDAVGQYIATNRPRLHAARAEHLIEIIGIVRSPHEEFFEPAAPHRIYRPLAQARRSNIYLHVKTSPAAASALLEPLRRELRSFEREAPLLLARPLAVFLEKHLNRLAIQTAAILFGAFGGVALLLAVVGVYGVKAHAVTLRTREIGIRKALGASSTDVLGLILKQGLWQTAIGLGVGLGLALLVGKILANMLYQVSPFDPFALLAATFLLAASALLACWLPARRATKVDPMIALRAE